jgi:hypothetical protein
MLVKRTLQYDRKLKISEKYDTLHRKTFTVFLNSLYNLQLNSQPYRSALTSLNAYYEPNQDPDAGRQPS